MVAPKRREKMACQRSMTQKKEKKEKGGNHVSKERERERDRDDSREKSHYLKE